MWVGGILRFVVMGSVALSVSKTLSLWHLLSGDDTKDSVHYATGPGVLVFKLRRTV